MIHIRDTLHIADIEISEALLDEARKIPELEILGKPEEMKFNENGNLFE